MLSKLRVLSRSLPHVIDFFCVFRVTAYLHTSYVFQFCPPLVRTTKILDVDINCPSATLSSLQDITAITDVHGAQKL